MSEAPRETSHSAPEHGISVKEMMMSKEEAMKLVSKAFLEQMHRMGYKDVNTFYMATKPGPSYETVRRVIYEARCVDAKYIVAIAQSLGYTMAEIIELLREIGEDNLADLIKPEALTARQIALLDIIRRLEAKGIDVYGIIKILAKAAQVDMENV